MSMKPILFSTEMVRAILDGRKSQTRRVVKPQPPEGAWPIYDDLDKYEGEGWAFQHTKSLGVDSDFQINFNPVFYLPRNGKCPYGKPGDILWVREKTFGNQGGFDNQDLCYATNCPCGLSDEEHKKARGWKSSRYMPRKAARLFLLVKDVRVERLQDITPADAVAEGAAEILLKPGHPLEEKTFERGTWDEKDQCRYAGARDAFAVLWDSINGKRDYPWSANPYVWVISFERTERPVAP